MSTYGREIPELQKDAAGVIDTTRYLIDEEMKIAERLERKATEQWQFVSLTTPLAIGGALTAAGFKGVSLGWIIAISVISLASVILLTWTMWSSSEMANVKAVKGIDPDQLDRYLAALDEEPGETMEDQIRADLARGLVKVARSREDANDLRRSLLKTAILRGRLTLGVSLLVLVVAGAAVMVNA